MIRKKTVLNLLFIAIMLTVLQQFGIYGCSKNQGHNSTDELSMSRYELNGCNAFVIDSFFVKHSAQTEGSKLLIEQPVVLTFFNQAKMVDKYEVENYDSLKAFLNMKHSGDRNMIYMLKNQYFYFVKDLRPKLEARSVRIIESFVANQVLEFHVNDTTIYVNVDEYKTQDGLLIFSPGKNPLFWTAAKEDLYCSGNYGIILEYFDCPIER